jgi:hypothetical protein
MFSLLSGAYRYLTQRDEYYVLIVGLDNAGKTVCRLNAVCCVTRSDGWMARRVAAVFVYLHGYVFLCSPVCIVVFFCFNLCVVLFFRATATRHDGARCTHGGQEV